MAFMGDKLEDKRLWKTRDTAQQARIENRQTGARVLCIGSEPRRAHGLAPVLVPADEPAQWPETTGERMVAALRTVAGNQPHSRFVALGTRPAHTEHWFAKMLADGADYSQTYSAGDNDPPFQKRTWAKANQSMRHMPDLEAAIRNEAGHARKDPATMAAFQALRLNQGTSDTTIEVLLDAGLRQTIEGEADQADRPVWGVDLGTTAAQSVVAAFWPESGRLEALAAFPSERSLAERGLRDGVGRLYVDSAKDGELIQCGGRSINVPELIQEALGRFGSPSAVVGDRWREGELCDALGDAGMPAAALELRGMGFKDGPQDARGFRRACAEGRVTPVRSRLLRVAMSEARTVSDPAGNAKLAKNSEGRRRVRARDDAAAAILAVAAGTRRAARSRTAGGYVGLIG